MAKGKKGKARTARTVAEAEGATARTPARTGARTRASCTRANEDTPPPSFSQAQQEWIERLIESRVANSQPESTGGQTQGK